jgi:hypothetical protein
MELMPAKDFSNVTFAGQFFGALRGSYLVPNGQRPPSIFCPFSSKTGLFAQNHLGQHPCCP